MEPNSVCRFERVRSFRARDKTLWSALRSFDGFRICKLQRGSGNLGQQNEPGFMLGAGHAIAQQRQDRSDAILDGDYDGLVGTTRSPKRKLARPVCSRLQVGPRQQCYFLAKSSQIVVFRNRILEGCSR